jgi:hypothetical protein
MSRRLALHLALVAGLALCLASAASGQALDELWSEYPLYPDGRQTVAPPQASPSSPAELEAKGLLRGSADMRSEAAATTTTAPDAPPWPMIGVLSAGALVLAFLVLARFSPAPSVPWAPSTLAGRVVQLGAVTRARSRRRTSFRGRSRAPARRPTPRRSAQTPTLPPPAPLIDAESEAHDLPEKPPQPLEEPAERANAEAEELELAFCTIHWWRGYVKSQFFARAVGPDGVEYVAARSPMFRWRRDEPPEPRKEIRAAHAALMERLLDDEWELAGPPAGHWYEVALQRPERPSLHTLTERLAREADPWGHA